MDISYTLYYVMMDHLRSMLKEAYTDTIFGRCNYLYADLTHIQDVERLEDKVLPLNLIGEIEVAFVNYNILYPTKDTIERVLLYSDGNFSLERYNNGLKRVLSEWILLVKARYHIKN